MKSKMLPSKTEYKNLINKQQALTEEEKQKVTHFENYILRSKQQEPYITEENLEIVHNYEKEISFLESLKERNQNQTEAIKRSEKIIPIISYEVQKQQLQEEQQRKETMAKKKQQTNAGYLNATILIYITINLGLMIAGLTWMFLK